MRPLTIFVLKRCPYCIKAKKMIAELMEQERYADIMIEYIDEAKNKKLAATFDYYYVPSFYLDQQKLYEGAIQKEQLVEVLDTYLSLLKEDV